MLYTELIIKIWFENHAKVLHFAQLLKFKKKRCLNLLDCGLSKVNYNSIKTRIMNGKEAAPHSWPWVVSIALDGPRDYVPHACGATLINSRYVITAAHCVLKNSVFSLVGTPDRNVLKHSSIERMIRVNIGIHDRFHDVTEENVYGVERISIVGFKYF